MNEDRPENGLNEASPDSVKGWARLRAEREARSLSLAQVSSHLKLTARQIEAIERGDLSALPGAAFSRGFVRNYARFLQLDPAPFVALIDEVEGREPAGIVTEVYSASLGRMPTSGNPRFSALPAALLVLALAAVLGAGWYYHWFEAREESALLASSEQSSPDAEESDGVAALNNSSAPRYSGTAVTLAQSEPNAAASVQSAPPASQSANVAAGRQSAPETGQSAVPAARQSAPASGQSAVPKSNQSVPAAAQSVVVKAVQSASPATGAQSAALGLPRIVLSFEGDSWVDVRDASGKSVFARMNQAGAVQEVQGTAPFTLTIGNAPKVKLTWKGRPMDLTPYIKGDVARLTVQ